MRKGDIVAAKMKRKETRYMVIFLRQISDRHFIGVRFNKDNGSYHEVTHVLRDFLTVEESLDHEIEYFPNDAPRPAGPRPWVRNFREFRAQFDEQPIVNRDPHDAVREEGFPFEVEVDLRP